MSGNEEAVCENIIYATFQNQQFDIQRPWILVSKWIVFYLLGFMPVNDHFLVKEHFRTKWRVCRHNVPCPWRPPMGVKKRSLSCSVVASQHAQQHGQRWWKCWRGGGRYATCLLKLISKKRDMKCRPFTLRLSCFDSMMLVLRKSPRVSGPA